ncbi:MAG: DUF4340 domain-containing protein [Bacteroidales bacterium]|jgi:hypothetical protein|nr:DUF4340 domain-containing protein [Bacteroidales bacterium]NCU36080.1 DUF4340 domain-containing protein [Candidatus Falkowbacteria bacterium]MDD2633152.1 DUF4340 domain-containing protein [Bacteroidales bacterium]MDD4176942.1 DUF4340 domain-containing protein [Bacteroidales bacterium]MDD4742167.1 DUF4340 domain-containing protein [Bacteroidales bacterium]
MFKKLNVKTLVIILIILAAIYTIAEMTGGRDRSFRNVLVEVDTADVESIYIRPAGKDLPVVLNRTSVGAWEVSGEGGSYPADIGMVRSILSQFTLMKPERVAATTDKKWADFELNDSLATRVTLKGAGEELADLMIGKFSYTQPPPAQGQQNPYQQQQRGKMTSYVRLTDETPVYAVDGFLKMAYQDNVNAYRNKSLVKVSRDDIATLSYTYPDRAIDLEKTDGHWMMNGQPADSAAMVKYLNKLSRLNSSAFVDPSVVKTSDATHKLTIQGSNFSPVVIEAFPVADTAMRYVVTSSANPGAEFDGSNARLFETIFVEEPVFLGVEK